MTLPPAGRVDISAALSSNAFFLGVDRGSEARHWLAGQNSSNLNWELRLSFVRHPTDGLP